MPIYLDGEYMDIYAADGLCDAVYLGSDQVWPGIKLPYVVEDANLSGASIPTGAIGCYVSLYGGAQNGGPRKTDTWSSGNIASASPGPDGGSGAAAIPRVFIPISAFAGATTYSLTKGNVGAYNAGGTASTFVCGPVTLSAGGGRANSSGGGIATVTGISGIPAYNGAAGGDGSGSPSAADPGGNSAGAGGGGGGAGRATKTKDKSPTTSSGGAGGTGVYIPELGRSMNGKAGTGGTASGSGTGSGSMASGYAGQGGGGHEDGSGYCRVEWVGEDTSLDVTTELFNPGAWSYQLPMWAAPGDLVDVVLLGGAAGGESWTSSAKGGASAIYASVSLVVGVDIQPGATLSGQLGAGGDTGNGSGGPTTCAGLLTSPGGSGLNSTSAGQIPTPLTLNGATYNRGGVGGAGGNLFANGKPGQAGRVYIRVRQP